MRILRPASFKHKNNTLKLCSQQLKTNFGRLNNYIRFYLWKRKIPPTQRSDGFCRVNRRQNESGVLRGGKFFRGLSLTEVVGLTVITNHFLWLCSKWTRPHLVALGKNTLCESEQTPFSVCGRSFYCRQQQDVAILTIIAIFKNSAYQNDIFTICSLRIVFVH